MSPEVINSHVRVDEKGVAWIEGTRVKVIEVVLDKLAYGWSPEEMHYQHPNLSLSQIHGALAYYYDHQNKIDNEIERQLKEVDAIRAATENKELQERFARAKRPR